MLSPVVLTIFLVFLVIASATDIHNKSIYNSTTYPGILTGIALRSSEGWAGFEESLAGLLICGGIMVVCFVLFGMGAGDVKLIAMMGAFLGAEKGIEAMLWTFTLGSIVAIVFLIWKFGIWTIIKGSFKHIFLMIRTMRWIPMTPEERKPLQWELYLAPAALVAVLITTYPVWKNVLG